MSFCGLRRFNGEGTLSLLRIGDIRALMWGCGPAKLPAGLELGPQCA